MPAAHVSPIVAALDHPEVTLNPDTVPVAALSLVDAFGEVPDPRTARGIRLYAANLGRRVLICVGERSWRIRPWLSNSRSL